MTPRNVSAQCTIFRYSFQLLEFGHKASVFISVYIEAPRKLKLFAVARRQRIKENSVDPAGTVVFENMINVTHFPFLYETSWVLKK